MRYDVVVLPAGDHWRCVCGCVWLAALCYFFKQSAAVLVPSGVIVSSYVEAGDEVEMTVTGERRKVMCDVTRVVVVQCFASASLG